MVIFVSCFGFVKGQNFQTKPPSVSPGLYTSTHFLTITVDLIPCFEVFSKFYVSSGVIDFEKSDLVHSVENTIVWKSKNATNFDKSLWASSFCSITRALISSNKLAIETFIHLQLILGSKNYEFWSCIGIPTDRNVRIVCSKDSSRFWNWCSYITTDLLLRLRPQSKASFLCWSIPKTIFNFLPCSGILMY